ncbi:hypothetical protein FRB90_003056 [Tulasnella sp. 427]|nr:hypothetical protein FRB90_003056 [Tulasnella sp. 427]
MNDSESLLHYGPLDVLRSDLSTLEPGKRLDDQMIRLGLGLWKDDLMKNDPDLAGDLVVQDTRFYRSLSNKGYQGILKSDKRVDILKTRFIIVPIHQNDHWYLAIIYGPGALVAASTSPGAPPPNANPLAGTAELETTAEISSQRQRSCYILFNFSRIRHPEAITTLQDWLRQETKRKYNLNHEKTLTGIHVEARKT